MSHAPAGSPPDTPDLDAAGLDVRTAVGRHHLRNTLAAFATGVVVVTVGGEHVHGMTANAFTSVSLAPPLVLICVRRDARMHEALLRTDTFAVSVLAGPQEGTARYFAHEGRPAGWAQFDGVSWVPGERTGAPLIDGALAWLECTRWRVVDGGDHSIFIGRLVSLRRCHHGAPLVFHDGQFRGAEGGVFDESGSGAVDRAGR